MQCVSIGRLVLTFRIHCPLKRSNQKQIVKHLPTMGVTRTDLTMVLNETLGNATEVMSGEEEGWGLLQALTIFAWVTVALFVIINLAAIVYCWWRGESKQQLYKHYGRYNRCVVEFDIVLNFMHDPCIFALQ